MGRTPASDRISGIGTSIFSEITALAVQHGAVNLGQGFPDFAAPEFVKEAAARHLREDRNQYAASPGVPRLRRVLADDWRRRHPDAAVGDPDGEITVAAGATELLHDALLAIVNPGDEVIVFEPAYDAYVPDISMAGGIPRFVRLEAPTFTFDAARLAAAFGPRTRALILNSPHNPTGKVFRRDELEIIAQLCRAHDVIVISDEVYAEIHFDTVPVPIATLPGMRQRTITIESMGKTFSVTGWKIGWAIAPAPLTAALRAVHQFVTFTNGTPFQEALADVLPLAARDGFYDELRATYRQRRDRLADILREVGLPPLPVDGAYFLLADVSDRAPTDVDFCKRLITEVGVAAIPTSVFYDAPRSAPQLARFCFAKSDATLALAAERLRRLVSL
ncbi:MAG TPA: methionine aminotransferase [Polyangia bacterium]|jgi:aspartate/methionine/tyrosine aminotransferase